MPVPAPSGSSPCERSTSAIKQLPVAPANGGFGSPRRDVHVRRSDRSEGHDSGNEPEAGEAEFRTPVHERRAP